MVCFVESHGEVGLEGFHRPGVGDGALYPVDDGDLLGVGNVDKDAAVAFLQLEGFRVGGQLHAAEEFGGGGVDDGKGAFAVAEPGESGLRVEAQVFGVGQRGEVLEHFVVGAAEDLQSAVVAVGHNDLVLVREIKDAGWFGHSRDAPDALAGSEVTDFQDRKSTRLNSSHAN